MVVDQGAGDTVTDSASLTRFTAADDVDHNVKRFDIFGELQRLHDDHAARFTLEILVERTAIDNDLARAALNEDASDGALATAGAVIVVADHLCHTLLEVKNLGLLSRMRMFGAGVDLELLDHCVAEGALRKHALDGDFESASRMLFLHLSKRRFDDAAGVAGVTIVRLLARFFSGENELVGVDHDDKIARVDVRREFGLVLTAQAQRDFAGQTAEHLITGIDHEPVALNLKRLGREGLHCVHLMVTASSAHALKAHVPPDGADGRLRPPSYGRTRCNRCCSE